MYDEAIYRRRHCDEESSYSCQPYDDDLLPAFINSVAIARSHFRQQSGNE